MRGKTSFSCWLEVVLYHLLLGSVNPLEGLEFNATWLEVQPVPGAEERSPGGQVVGAYD